MENKVLTRHFHNLDVGSASFVRNMAKGIYHRKSYVCMRTVIRFCISSPNPLHTPYKCPFASPLYISINLIDLLDKTNYDNFGEY